MNLVFVHGWSVTHTDTYGDLPEGLARRAREFGLTLDIAHIRLGRYISFHDEVTLDDIATAFNAALVELYGGAELPPFSCITHSTGGPVVRHWVEKYHGSRQLDSLPLRHLVMLAPANHGSALAAIGKARVGRIKAWFAGVEPGQRVLDWLSLGSQDQWQLNSAYLRYKPGDNGFYPFVLTGQGIDRKMYDFLNPYLVEPGSDGVVRVSGANLNCRFIRLSQGKEEIRPGSKVYPLSPPVTRPVRTTPATPLGVFHHLSHSGSDMGVMGVGEKRPAFATVVSEVLKCLAVTSNGAYAARGEELRQLTEAEQAKPARGKDRVIGRYAMLVFRVRDNHGNPVGADNFDLLLLAGKTYSPDRLPAGFFVDRQLNRDACSLVYYVDADRMADIADGLFGIRLVLRPGEGSGFAWFHTCEYRSEGLAIGAIIAANQTTYIDIQVNRHVDRNLFRFSDASAPRASFRRTRPSGKAVSSDDGG